MTKQIRALTAKNDELTRLYVKKKGRSDALKLELLRQQYATTQAEQERTAKQLNHDIEQLRASKDHRID